MGLVGIPVVGKGTVVIVELTVGDVCVVGASVEGASVVGAPVIVGTGVVETMVCPVVTGFVAGFVVVLLQPIAIAVDTTSVNRTRIFFNICNLHNRTCNLKVHLHKASETL